MQTKKCFSCGGEYKKEYLFICKDCKFLICEDCHGICIKCGNVTCPNCWFQEEIEENLIYSTCVYCIECGKT